MFLMLVKTNITHIGSTQDTAFDGVTVKTKLRLGMAQYLFYETIRILIKTFV